MGFVNVSGIVLDASAGDAWREEVVELLRRDGSGLMVRLLVEVLDRQRQAVQAQIEF